MNTASYHRSRFQRDPRRELLWATLWRVYFSKLIDPNHCVLDLGAGHGSFINNVVARRRIAVDLWPEFTSFLAPGIEGVVGSMTDLSFIEDRSIDFAFASNVFEHLTRADLVTVLEQLRHKLQVGGTLVIVQPNYRYAYREYFDDYTHVSIYSHVSIADLLVAERYTLLEVVPRFLPLTIKSRLPVWPLLVQAYLISRIRPLAKQMLIRARPNVRQDR